MNFDKPDSPFTPGRPVPVDFFVGRKKQVEEISNYMGLSFRKQQMENILIYGDRGIGKSSLAGYVSAIAERKYDIVPVHISLSENGNLDGLIQNILIRIFEEIGRSNWFDKVKKVLGKYVKRVGLFGVQVDLNLSDDELLPSIRSFDVALKNIINEIAKAGKGGLILTLDDINGLTQKEEFANWYKGFSDGVSMKNLKLPISILLLTTPIQRERLYELQPSLMRIFRPIEIDRLSDDEVNEFFRKTYDKVGIKVEDDALKRMVHYSSGLPIIMQEIGDAVFWSDQDGIIDKKDAYMGVLRAANIVGEKYLTPTIYKTLKSTKYRSILRKLGKMLISSSDVSHFYKKDIESKLDENEKKSFNNFLQKMKKLKVIENDTEGGRGSYRFVNELFPLYIWMEAETFGKRK